MANPDINVAVVNPSLNVVVTNPDLSVVVTNSDLNVVVTNPIVVTNGDEPLATSQMYHYRVFSDIFGDLGPSGYLTQVDTDIPMNVGDLILWNPTEAGGTETKYDVLRVSHVAYNTKTTHHILFAGEVAPYQSITVLTGPPTGQP